MRRVLVLLLLAACGRTVLYEYDFLPPRLDAGVPHAGPPDAGVKPCVSGVVALSHATPSIFLVIDRSGSMSFDLKGNEGVPFGAPLEGPTRWNILADVLGDVLPVHERDLSMGVMLFPANNECGLSAVEDLSPRLANAGSILSLLASRTPGGGTPIAAAMQAVRVPASFAQAKSIILITDGEPNCNSMLDPLTCTCTQQSSGFPPTCAAPDICLDDTRSVQAITNLRADAGVVTHVVGFATVPRASVTLDAMAVAGGAPRMGTHKYNSAETQAELTEVLTGISEREKNCTWTALTKLKPDDMLELRLDGMVVPEGSGWQWLNRERGEFALLGDWCEKSLQGSLAARLTCKQ